ncbi:ribosome biogenesis/translation initiation ATPase RLI [Natronobacterium texcoconense]|uniref:ATP-binding cassette, sub-family E, member 1 n=1 Tax=Natronobacterium texcoconense TaxID=1095778 RepID=A0A1H1HJX9_NATTX|nr:ribosome biogenesis/translation initiation ATPase RLI [Natronobacterium texcoconense]SDR25734.1 ATP-binding cassette, sub-family E, member 1 [Natronobacterium texcoconense]
MTDPTDIQEQEYVAIIDQDEVTDEVRDIAVKYDPLNRSGREGFHVTDDGGLHIDDAVVMREHKLIEKKIPNDAIRIVPLPAETGQLVHQYGDNGFRLYELPMPEDEAVIGLLGRNGIGKSTALRVLAGEIIPNFGLEEDPDWDRAVDSFRGTTLQTHLEQLRNGDVTTATKRQRVEALVDEAAADETVRERLAACSNGTDGISDELDLTPLLDRRMGDLSGGERQRLEIATTLATDADLYLFDEPSSFLDVERRLSVARTIRDRITEMGAAAVVVEHDLATLDLLADGIYIAYGEPGDFGVVSQRLGSREGINQFLEGQLQQENVQIRKKSISFPGPRERSIPKKEGVLEYPDLEVGFEEFSLSVEGGTAHEGESIGIVGANALGKTTFAKLLAGGIEPDVGTVPDHATVSYKPQYIAPDGDETVRERFVKVADVRSQAFETQVSKPFDLETLFDRPLSALSGGELQRVAVALCLAREADMYLLDEPSAFLDVNRRVAVADQLRRFARKRDRPLLVIDHDLFLLNRVSDRLVVFDGESGTYGEATAPQPMREGMNDFLSSLGVTFRRDERTGRPRVNKPGSQLDRKQKRSGEYYYTG